MNNERKTSTALDQKWYERLSKIIEKMGEVYIALEPKPETLYAQRAAFDASDYSQLPDLYPDRINRDDFLAIKSELSQFAEEIAAEESDSRIRTAYQEVIALMLKNASLILAAIDRDYETMDSLNRSIYGQPDREVFTAACDWIRFEAQHAIAEDHPKLQQLKQEVLQHIPDLGGNRNRLIPDEAIFTAVKDAHFSKDGFYAQLFGPTGLPTTPYVMQEEGDIICEQVLKHIDSEYTLATSDINIWSTMRDKKFLLRPKGYRIDRDEFIGTIGHEIGCHIWQMTNGARQPLRLLGLGMAGYEHSDEGRAFLREQIVYEHEAVFLQQFQWEYIVMLHLSVSLAQGLYDHRYNFVELYNLLYILYYFWRERRMPQATNNELFARDEAWMLAVRIFKGTNGKSGSYVKDIVYLEGNIKSWQLAKQDPSLILHDNVGRFDTSNPEQVALLRYLGILPA